MPLLNTSGKRIEVLRTVRGLNQAELGALVGLAQNSISAYERDKWKLRADTAQALALALGTTAAFLLCLTDTPDPEMACVPA